MHLEQVGDVRINADVAAGLRGGVDAHDQLAAPRGHFAEGLPPFQQPPGGLLGPRAGLEEVDEISRVRRARPRNRALEIEEKIADLPFDVWGKVVYCLREDIRLKSNGAESSNSCVAPPNIRDVLDKQRIVGSID